MNPTTERLAPFVSRVFAELEHQVNPDTPMHPPFDPTIVVGRCLGPEDEVLEVFISERIEPEWCLPIRTTRSYVLPGDDPTLPTYRHGVYEPRRMAGIRIAAALVPGIPMDRSTFEVRLVCVEYRRTS